MRASKLFARKVTNCLGARQDSTLDLAPVSCEARDSFSGRWWTIATAHERAAFWLVFKAVGIDLGFRGSIFPDLVAIVSLSSLRDFSESSRNSRPSDLPSMNSATRRQAGDLLPHLGFIPILSAASILLAPGLRFGELKAQSGHAARWRASAQFGRNPGHCTFAFCRRGSGIPFDRTITPSRFRRVTVRIDATGV